MINLLLLALIACGDEKEDTSKEQPTEQQEEQS